MRAVGDRGQSDRIDSGAADIVGEADPWRRHFGDRGEAQAFQVGEAEVGPRLRADDEEGIARHDVAEADEVGPGIAVAQHHHSQRTAPHDVDLAGEQRLHRSRRAGRGHQDHVDAGLGEGPRGMGGIEWRVEERAEILGQSDCHSI